MQIKTTNDVTKAIRFLDVDKALGVVSYLTAMDIASECHDLRIVDVDDYYAEDLNRQVFTVVFIDRVTDEARYLMHPCHDPFAHINL